VDNKNCKAGFKMPEGDAFVQLGLPRYTMTHALTLRTPHTWSTPTLLATIKEAFLSAQTSFFFKSSFLLEPFPKVGYQSLILNE
jgi:hypothetical protein